MQSLTARGPFDSYILLGFCFGYEDYFFILWVWVWMWVCVTDFFCFKSLDKNIVYSSGMLAKKIAHLLSSEDRGGANQNCLQNPKNERFFFY